MILMLSVDAFSNGRTLAENIEGKEFKNTNALLKHIKSEDKEVDVHDGESVLMYSMSDFMTELNDQSCSTENYWTTFVHLEE